MIRRWQRETQAEDRFSRSSTRGWRPARARSRCRQAARRTEGASVQDVYSCGSRAGVEPGGCVTGKWRARQLRGDAQPVRCPKRHSSRRSSKPRPDAACWTRHRAAGLAFWGLAALLRAGLRRPLRANGASGSSSSRPRFDDNHIPDSFQPPQSTVACRVSSLMDVSTVARLGFASPARGLVGISEPLTSDLVMALTLTVALASFIRDRGQLLSNISLWLFLFRLPCRSGDRESDFWPPCSC